MNNTARKCSNYEYLLPGRQLAALLEIASKKDRSIHELVLKAIDQYLAREKHHHERIRKR
jgi:hypothetical protein